MIIDEQGRLFGKVNIIDFLVAVFLLSCLPAFYYGWKIFVEPHKPLVENKTTIEIQLKEYEELKNLKLNWDLEDTRREQILKKHPRLKKYLKGE